MDSTKLSQKNTSHKSYSVEGNQIIFDLDNEGYEADLEFVLNLLSIDYKDVAVTDGKISATQEFIVRGTETENQFHSLPIEEIEYAVMKSNYKILQP